MSKTNISKAETSNSQGCRTICHELRQRRKSTCTQQSHRNRNWKKILGLPLSKVNLPYLYCVIYVQNGIQKLSRHAILKDKVPVPKKRPSLFCLRPLSRRCGIKGEQYYLIFPLHHSPSTNWPFMPTCAWLSWKTYHSTSFKIMIFGNSVAMMFHCSHWHSRSNFQFGGARLTKIRWGNGRHSWSHIVW